MKNEEMVRHAINQWAGKRLSLELFRAKTKSCGFLQRHCGQRMVKVKIYAKKNFFNDCNCSSCSQEWQATVGEYIYCADPNCTHWENKTTYDC